MQRNHQPMGFYFNIVDSQTHHFRVVSSMICSSGGEALREVLKNAFINSRRSWYFQAMRI